MDDKKLHSDSYEELQELRKRIDRLKEPELYEQIVRLLYERRNEKKSVSIEVKRVHTSPNLMGRALAFLIDYSLVTVSTTILVSILPSSRLLTFFTVIFFWFLYNVYFEYKNGASFGNRFLGLKVLSLDKKSTKLRLSQSFLRHLADMIDFFFIGFIMISTTPRNQRVGDRWANTIVVDVNDVKQGIFK